MGEKKSILPDELVMNKIYMVRGQKVMLDRDLAELYDVKAIRLREQVKRNQERFPETFMFQLTEDEVETMVSQNAIPSKQHLGGALPYVFTEHGVLQLANVLKSGRAAEVSIKIVEVFVKMREMILTHKDILLKVEQMEKTVAGQDEKIAAIFEYLKQFIKDQETPRPEIGYKRSSK
ncbi:MAG: ORF6N domain-containing protein [Flavobacteriales bacterium]